MSHSRIEKGCHNIKEIHWYWNITTVRDSVKSSDRWISGPQTGNYALKHNTVFYIIAPVMRTHECKPAPLWELRTDLCLLRDASKFVARQIKFFVTHIASAIIYTLWPDLCNFDKKSLLRNNWIIHKYDSVVTSNSLKYHRITIRFYIYNKNEYHFFLDNELYLRIILISY